MPNAIVRANAPAMPRRLFLAAGPAAAVFAALQGATSAATPASADADLFALVEVGKSSLAEIETYCSLCDSVKASQEGREVLPEHEVILSAAEDKYRDATWQGMQHVPQTVTGFRAMLEWLSKDGGEVGYDDDLVDAFIASALASPVLMAEA